MTLIFLLFIAFFLLISAGFFIFQLFAIEERNIFTAMWIGMLPIGLLAFIVNFFFPLHSTIALVCLFPSILGIKICLKHLKTWLTQPKKACIFQALFVIAIIVFSLGTVLVSPLGKSYDTDLYHLQIVSWIMDFPTVPGLGNVHSRLANTSTWHTLAALIPLELPYIPTFMTALFFIGVFGWTLSHLLSAVTIWEKTFLLCLIPLCLTYVMGSSSANLYTDEVSLFLAIIACYIILKIFLLADINP